MTVFVSSDFCPACEALWTKIEILTDGARDPEAIELLGAGVALIPAVTKHVKKSLCFLRKSYLVKISVIPGFSSFFGGIFIGLFFHLKLKTSS